MTNLVAGLLLIFTLNMSAQQPTVQPPSSLEPGVQVRQEFLRAYNAKDVDAVLALYAEDATLVSDGGTFKGRDEIRQWIKSGVDQGSTLMIEPSVERNSGTLAYGTGRTRRLVGSVIHLGEYLIVMEKISGEWKIVQHFSLSAGEVPADPAVAPSGSQANGGTSTPQPKVIPVDSSGKDITPVLAGPPESVKMRSGLVILAPGKSVGKHSTERNEQLLVVFEGQGEMAFENGSKLPVLANTAIY